MAKKGVPAAVSKYMSQIGKEGGKKGGKKGGKATGKKGFAAMPVERMRAIQKKALAARRKKSKGPE